LVGPDPVVDDGDFGARARNHLCQFVDFTLTKHVGSVLGSGLGQFADDLVARRPGEVANLGEVGIALVDALGDELDVSL